MKLIRRVVLVGLVSLNIIVAFQGASAAAATTISVATYGAKCDGMRDDTVAIQAALNAAAAAGGGTVTLPGATCLLNSSNRSGHPWFFYNLRIPSGVTLQGTTGSKLLQGPNGRHARVSGATQVRNTVLAVGNNYATTTYNNPPGGFYALQAISAGNGSVTLVTPAQASHFAAGDYVAVYETNPAASGCDVCAAQPVQLSAVNRSSGQLTLADPVLRTFSAPFIGKVTSLTAHDIAVSGIIVQGAEPLAVQETFNFSAANNQFLSETTIGDSNGLASQLNTVEHFNFTGNTFAPVSGSGPWLHQELCQRNSQNGTWSGNTFQVAAVGQGEHAGNLTFTGNHIYLHQNAADGVTLEGQNVKFDGNDVHTVGNYADPSGWGSIVADVYATGNNTDYTGNIQITNNTIQCAANGNNCILLESAGSTVSGNTITATGSATGLYVAAPGASVTGNTFQMGTGTGILLYATPVESATVTGNKLNGTGRVGIYVRTPPTRAAGGGDEAKRSPSATGIYNNTITGFAIPLDAPGAQLGPTNIPKKNIR